MQAVKENSKLAMEDQLMKKQIIEVNKSFEK